MKLRDFVALALIVVLALGSEFLSEGEDPGSQRRPDPYLPPEKVEPGKPLPPKSRLDPGLVVEIEGKTGTSTGTAFSIHESGVWVTARHVTDDCNTVALKTNSGRLVKVEKVESQPHADISILWTRGGTAALPIIQPRLRVGQDGYSFGFPQGEAGDVYGRIVGRRNMLSRGRYRTDEPVVAWTQLRRVPDRGADLGGISGGPWVNSSGDVIGVHVAGAPRRGRSYSTAPESLLRAIRGTGVTVSQEHSGDSVTPRRFAGEGARLRRSQAILQVVCLADRGRWTGGRRYQTDLYAGES